MRVIDFLTDAATKPVVTEDKSKSPKALPPTPTDGTLVGQKSDGAAPGAAGAQPQPASTTP
jgi:hypothetical protein